MDGGRCILQLRGVRPFFSEKFDITKHPHYKYLADADKKNTFDVDKNTLFPYTTLFRSFRPHPCRWLLAAILFSF